MWDRGTFGWWRCASVEQHHVDRRAEHDGAPDLQLEHRDELQLDLPVKLQFQQGIELQFQRRKDIEFQLKLVGHQRSRLHACLHHRSGYL